MLRRMGFVVAVVAFGMAAVETSAIARDIEHASQFDEENIANFRGGRAGRPRIGIVDPRGERPIPPSPNTRAGSGVVHY